MASDWVCNLPITSKVDVYSYRIVVLVMVTRRSPAGIQTVENEGHGRVVTWVREKMQTEAAIEELQIEEIVDPLLGYNSDVNKIELLVRVALNCLEENKDLV